MIIGPWQMHANLEKKKFDWQFLPAHPAQIFIIGCTKSCNFNNVGVVVVNVQLYLHYTFLVSGENLKEKCDSTENGESP